MTDEEWLDQELRDDDSAEYIEELLASFGISALIIAVGVLIFWAFQ